MIDYNNLSKVEVQINDIKYILLVAKSDEEKEYGLQGVSDLEGGGMLFDYSDSEEKELSFWMHDTTIPLDIIFVSEDDEVLKVIQGEPESDELLTCVAPGKHYIKYVIELNANSGVQKGDDVEFDEFDEDSHPELEPNKMYIIGSDGEIQAELMGGERIFSRISTRKMLRAAKKAYVSKLDKDYKKLGKIVFNELTAQDNRDPEYVEGRN